MLDRSSLPHLDWLSVDMDERRVPWHRVALKCTGRKHYGWLLKSVGQPGGGVRNNIIIRDPHRLLPFAPLEIADQWRSYMADLNDLKRNSRYQSVSTLKLVDRLHREGHRRWASYPILTVAHRFGAVPALVIGQVSDRLVALLPEAFGSGGTRTRYQEDERIEILQSHQRYLAELFHAYYEQIAFYLDAVLFGSSDVRATAYCRRIREIIGESIRTKLNDIEACKQASKAFPLAQEIQRDCRTLIEEAKAVDHFGHLIVNHLYRFKRIDVDKEIHTYSTRLAAMEVRRDSFDSSTVGFLKRCAAHIEDPKETFLDEVNTNSDTREPWLHRFAVAAAMVGEIAEYSRESRIDRPGIFLSHHFGVDEGNRFADEISVSLQREHVRVTLIRGRRLREDIRWSLLARLWMADYQILFLPRQFVRADGEPKVLHVSDDWVIFELVYGRLLEHPLVTIASAPISDVAISQFRDQLQRYTEEKELPQVPEEGWQRFVRRTKEQLRQQLHSRAYIQIDLNDVASSLPEFTRRVVQPAAEHVLTHLMESWCSFFDANCWSVIQTLIGLCRAPGSGYRANPVMALRSDINRATIAEYVAANREQDDRLAWARNKTDERILSAVGSYLGHLTRFAYSLDGSSFRPLYIDRIGRRNVHFRLGQVYEAICKHLDIAFDAKRFDTTLEHLMSIRYE